MKIIYIAAAIFFLTGCPSEPSGSNSEVRAGVEIVCAEAANTAEATHCNADAPLLGVLLDLIIPSAHAEQTFINAGQVSRGQMIESTIQAENFSAVDKTVWVEMVFDAGCGGASEWNILPKQQTTIGAAQSMAFTVGGQCGDMQLGARTLTATLYNSEGFAVLGQVVVGFNLIE